jgi:hypothetical protein
MQTAPARRTRAAKGTSMAIRPLTHTGKRLRGEKAANIAIQWMDYPRKSTTRAYVQYCTRNGGVAAAVILNLHANHGVRAAMAFAKQVANHGRTNYDAKTDATEK